MTPVSLSTTAFDLHQTLPNYSNLRQEINDECLPQTFTIEETIDAFKQNLVEKKRNANWWTL